MTQRTTPPRLDVKPTLEVCFLIPIIHMQTGEGLNYICVISSMWNLILHNLNLKLHSTTKHEKTC